MGSRGLPSWWEEKWAEEPARATVGDRLLAAALGIAASGATFMAGGSLGMGPPALLLVFLLAPALLGVANHIWWLQPAEGASEMS